MKTGLKAFFLGASAALLLSILLPSALASETRDTPTIGNYSAIDINDLYMFRDPPCTTSACSSPSLIVALTTQALADPLFQPTYHFQANARYSINFTTRMDARPTASIDFVFGPFGNGPSCPAPEPACQTFKARFPDGTVVEGLTTQGTFGATHLPPVVTTSGPISVFAGPREDPFFFDLVGFKRSVAAGANKFTGVDAFKGKNVNAIVMRFPIDMVFPASKCTGTTTSGFFTPCGAWATTYLGDFRSDDIRKFENRPEDLRQLDRMGNPLVGSALIPADLRDSFNFGNPRNDAANFGPAVFDEILTLDKEFGTCPQAATSAASCNPNVPLLASVLVPDILRFASNVPDGYPNGRQLPDRSTDILISLILQLPGFTDGTAAKTYCSVFPFLGPPLSLSASSPFNLQPQSCP